MSMAACSAHASGVDRGFVRSFRQSSEEKDRMRVSISPTLSLRNSRSTSHQGRQLHLTQVGSRAGALKHVTCNLERFYHEILRHDVREGEWPIHLAEHGKTDGLELDRSAGSQTHRLSSKRHPGVKQHRPIPTATNHVLAHCFSCSVARARSFFALRTCVRIPASRSTFRATYW